MIIIGKLQYPLSGEILPAMIEAPLIEVQNIIRAVALRTEDANEKVATPLIKIQIITRAVALKNENARTPRVAGTIA